MGGIGPPTPQFCNASDQQQSIEAVVLDIPAPGGQEAFREVHFDLGNLDRETVAVLELEVLDPGRAAFGPGKLVGPLGDDAVPASATSGPAPVEAAGLPGVSPIATTG